MKDWLTLVLSIFGLLGGLYATRASREATRANREANQIKWLQEAKDEAAQAKKELAETRIEQGKLRDQVAEMQSQNAKAQRDLMKASDTVEEWTRWGLRVIDWAQDPTVDRDEIKRLINGGPPVLRQGNHS